MTEKHGRKYPQVVIDRQFYVLFMVEGHLEKGGQKSYTTKDGGKLTRLERRQLQTVPDL